MKQDRFIDGLVVGAFAMLLVQLVLYKCDGMEPCVKVTTDTVVVRDTISYDRPVPVHDTVRSFKKVYVYRDREERQDSTDLFAQGDSVLVPISQKEYSDDSTYTAWVSGYEVSLDSIRVYRQQVFVTKTILSKPAKRWNIGIQGGYGLGVLSRRFEPYIGVGISYTPP